MKAQQQIEALAGDGQRAGLHASLILFIALPEAKDNINPGVIPLVLLPRRCPVCRDDTIIGHGQRLRQCHDDQRRAFWVRRGICRACKKAFTVLPDWLAPSTHYSLHCRRQACEQIASGDSVEQAVPHCKDPARLPDPATVRRWNQRRLLSVWCWVKAGVRNEHFLQSPTILAWDLGALCNILPLEAKSP